MRITKNLNKIVKGADGLSVGISVVVAVILGVFIGIWLKNLTGSTFLFFVGIFIGIAAAILNVYKSYKRLDADMKDLENDPKYKNYKPDFDDEEDE